MKKNSTLFEECEKFIAVSVLTTFRTLLLHFEGFRSTGAAVGFDVIS